MRRPLSRRHLLRGAAALSVLGGLGLPRRVRAAAPPTARKFLFLFAGGAWDTTQVFDPHFEAGGVDMPPETFLGEVGDLRFAAGPDRPSVERFFVRWGHRTALVNGIDSHSIGHDAGTRFMMTGSSASALSDWPTLLAAHAPASLPMPHVVFSGPVFAGSRAGSVVRGGGGLLLDLISGRVVGAADQPAPAMARPVDSMIDAAVGDRLGPWMEARTGLGRRRIEDLRDSLGRAMELEGRQFEMGLDDDPGGLFETMGRATELMRLGLTRTVMLDLPGSWDTHGNNARQGPWFERIFDALDRLLDRMTSLPGEVSPTLADEVVIVLLSEFGRTPLLNGGGGKDHWPWGSAMVVGPGVAGGRVIGATDSGLAALPINLRTGRVASGGDLLGSEHFGAALLQLGGLDPADFLDAAPLQGLLA